MTPPDGAPPKRPSRNTTPPDKAPPDKAPPDKPSSDRPSRNNAPPDKAPSEEAPPRFAYYSRLSAANKRLYRKSDAIVRVPLAEPEALFPLVRALAAALESGVRVRVGRAAKTLTDALLAALGAPPVRVRVREVRPSNEQGELHGLYTFEHGGKAPEIDVWMRTAAHERTVKFPTFLRTLMHEVVHHLDVTLFQLSGSLHTQGFFRREASLSRALLSAFPRARGRARPEEPPAPAKAPRPERPAKAARPPKPVQLALFEL